jgi:hypothetical protein
MLWRLWKERGKERERERERKKEGKKERERERNKQTREKRKKIGSIKNMMAETCMRYKQTHNPFNTT